MSRVLSLLLVPPVRQAVQARYRAYRRSGASALTAFFTTLLVALGWMLLRLESPAWRRVRAGRAYWFPHLSAERPRPADALRYLLQGRGCCCSAAAARRCSAIISPVGGGCSSAMPTGCRACRSG